MGALKGFLWAAAGGDVNAISSGLVVSSDVKPQVDALFAKLPPEIRSEYGNPERLLATLAAADIRDASAFQVVREQNMGNDGVRIQFQTQESADRITGGTSFLFQQDTGGWHMVFGLRQAEELYDLLPTAAQRATGSQGANSEAQH